MGLVAIVIMLALICPLSLIADDSQWSAISEDALFAQLRDFAEKLEEELRSLPEQTRESKEFVLRREWNRVISTPSIPEHQRIEELKLLLGICEKDPDLAALRQPIYGDWFMYSMIDAPNLSRLDELFEQLLIDIKENELRARTRPNFYFMRLSQLQPENLHEKMNESLGRIVEILETSQRERVPFQNFVDVRSFIPKLKGAARFYALPGQKMELKGVLMDGTTFDLESLKGKVVYVYFWGMGCGPCIREMPELHTKYLDLKDVGFEVVTYSVDTNLDALVAFQDRTKYTWKTISVVKSREQGFQNYYELYGGTYLPKTVLIGRDGKVIGTDVRGIRLGQELNKLFDEQFDTVILFQCPVHGKQ